MGASACTSGPTEPPSTRPSIAASNLPSTVPDASDGGPCIRNRDEGNPLKAGWLAQGLAATFGTGPCIYDAMRRTWLSFGPRTEARYVTDGSGLAGSVTPGTLTVIASDERATELSLPSWGADWTTSGGAMSPMIGGGYLIDRAPVLAHWRADRAAHPQRLPGCRSDEQAKHLRPADRPSDEES